MFGTVDVRYCRVLCTTTQSRDDIHEPLFQVDSLDNTAPVFTFCYLPHSSWPYLHLPLSYLPPGKDAYGAKLNFGDLQIGASIKEGIRVDTCSGSITGKRS